MSSTVVYLEGNKSEEGDDILVPLSSAALVFIIQYCGPELFDLKFSSVDVNATPCFAVNISCLENIKHEINSENHQDCMSPVIRQSDDIWVRSGLCGTIRYIVAQSHKERPDEHLDDLLGFRAGSLKACAEVSGWTKLCEVELPDAITDLSNKIRTKKSTEKETLNLPEDLMKLEWHFLKPAKIHNDDKMKRPFLRQIQNEADIMATSEDASEFQYHREILNPHGLTKFFVNVNPVTKSNKSSKSNDSDSKQANEKCLKNGCLTGGGDQRSSNDKITDVNNLKNLLKKMTIDNLEFAHLYSEGITITIADLILYTQIYHFLESIDFKMGSVSKHIHQIITWFDHMTSLPRIRRTAIQCGYELGVLEQNRTKHGAIDFNVEEGLFDKINEDEMELSRRSRGKYRAIKPDVWSALDKVVKGNIQIRTGSHPRGDNTAINWSEVPSGVDPGSDLPKKRLQRKCEQLENLVTAVLELAKPGDVIVDFCSGGGHLGIAVAHFLPKCKVYLIENKEESLIRAKQRIDKLQMKNVTIYQCNQNYFKGKFDIGMCLHACGVATDMVMRQCLQNNASFVICPCCYGGIQNTHLITYPTSNYYREAGIVNKDFLTLGHAADQTEFNMILEEQGKYCANLVDTDRAALAKEHGYTVTLCSLKPLTCTPKNNLLIGVAPSSNKENQTS